MRPGVAAFADTLEKERVPENPGAAFEADATFAAMLDPDLDLAPAPVVRSNMETLQGLLKSIAMNDFPGLAEYLSDEVECEIHVGMAMPWKLTSRGVAESIDLIESNFKSVRPEQAPQVRTLIDHGDRIVLIGREQGRLAVDGQPYDAVMAQEFIFANGRITRFMEIVAPTTGS